MSEADGNGGKTAGVLAPPPLIYGLPLLAGLFLHYQGAGLDLGLPLWLRLIVGVPAIIAGFTLITLAVIRFWKAGTDPEPWKPSTALVVDGVYKLTRNPMYVGMALVYVAIALFFDCGLALALLVPAILAIHFGVILREERYLARLFGEPYEVFKRSSRRWL